MSKYHVAVLLQEIIDFLNIKKDHWYVDATLGGGGHTIELLQRGGKVVGIDVDQDALDHVASLLSRTPFQIGTDVRLVKGNFKNIDILVQQQGIESVSGVLFDFGVSSFQLDTGEKGFSFLHDGPLDMRMDQTLTVTAADLVNGLHAKELMRLFLKLGQDWRAKKIALEIVSARSSHRIERTSELVRVIEKSYGVTNEEISVKRRAEMCKRVFQALRIAVNDELHVIEDALPKAVRILSSRARLAVLAFHSLEDRIVKEQFAKFEKIGLGNAISDKPIIAKDKETHSNKRSRSAKLRVFEKV